MSGPFEKRQSGQSIAIVVVHGRCRNEKPNLCTHPKILNKDFVVVTHFTGIVSSYFYTNEDSQSGR